MEPLSSHSDTKYIESLQQMLRNSKKPYRKKSQPTATAIYHDDFLITAKLKQTSKLS